jgi:glycosyltransferase involved in cell wall biosynthesis
MQTLDLLALPFEIILVNDASPDNTGLIADQVAASLGGGCIRVIHHSQNLGRGAAFLSGACEARGDIVGFLDIDLEVSPVYLVECIRVLRNENADLVVGQRHYRITIGLIHRHILSATYSWLMSKVLRIPREFDSESGYKFFKRTTLQRYLHTFAHKGWFWDTEVVSRFHWDGLNIRSVPCLFMRDESKRSTVRPVRDTLVYGRNLFAYWQASRNLVARECVPSTPQVPLRNVA